MKPKHISEHEKEIGLIRRGCWVLLGDFPEWFRAFRDRWTTLFGAWVKP